MVYTKAISKEAENYENCSKRKISGRTKNQEPRVQNVISQNEKEDIYYGKIIYDSVKWCV